jgi:hypothetical protein
LHHSWLFPSLWRAACGPNAQTTLSRPAFSDAACIGSSSGSRGRRDSSPDSYDKDLARELLRINAEPTRTAG